MTKAKKKRARNIDWDKQPLGVESDRSIAIKLGVNAGTVAAARIARGFPVAPSVANCRAKGIDWDKEEMLGKTYDKDLAQKHGVSGAAVRKARNARGIPSFGMSGRRRGSIDWSKEPLGKVSDSDLAIMLDTNLSTVTAARIRLGIRRRSGDRSVLWTDD